MEALLALICPPGNMPLEGLLTADPGMANPWARLDYSFARTGEGERDSWL